MTKKLLTYNSEGFVLRQGRNESRVNLKEAVGVRELADKRAARIIDRALVKSYPFSGSLPPFLDAHQVDGVRWILTRSRSYLAHAPGAGKTLEAILASALAQGSGQVAFIVPPTATANWEREIMKWVEVYPTWPSIAVIPDSNHYESMNWRADILIVPHSMLGKCWVLERLIKRELRFIAVDEASAFKEPTAQRTIALFGGLLSCGHRSPGLVRDARHSVLMDGSPAPNGRPMELWAPTYAMAPETIDFMDRQEFGFEYCGAIRNRFGGWEFKHSSNEEALRKKMQRKFMHVVTEEQLDHPERRRSILFMNKDPRSAKHVAWERKNLGRFNFNDLDEEMSQGELAEYRKELGTKKVPWIANYVSNRLQAKEEHLLLFAWHRDVVQGLAEKLAQYKPGVVMGGTPEKERERYFAEFQAGKRRLLILNIASGGRIHNLTRADRVIFGEFSWTDETNKQAEKRASRKGNEKAFTRCEYVAVPGSLDERVLTSLFRKISRTKKIIG